MNAVEGVVPVAPAGLTHEDTVRAGDRARVFYARRRGRRWSLLWLLVGPGILAMLGENGGPSMISYATTGATYGLGFFVPFIGVTFAMAVICQEMCMRVGAVTHRDLRMVGRDPGADEPERRRQQLVEVDGEPRREQLLGRVEAGGAGADDRRTGLPGLLATRLKRYRPRR